jgi:hypothetical protein
MYSASLVCAAATSLAQQPVATCPLPSRMIQVIQTACPARFPEAFRRTARSQSRGPLLRRGIFLSCARYRRALCNPCPFDSQAASLRFTAQPAYSDRAIGVGESGGLCETKRRLRCDGFTRWKCGARHGFFLTAGSKLLIAPWEAHIFACAALRSVGPIGLPGMIDRTSVQDWSDSFSVTIAEIS